MSTERAGWISGRTLWDLVERRAEASPEQVMLVDEEHRSLTFGALRVRALRAAAGFHALGIGPGTQPPGRPSPLE